MSHVRAVDVCVVVRDLFESIQDIGITPQPPVELAKCIVPAVAGKISSHGKYRIELSQRSWGSQHLYGMLLRYSDHAQIIYSQDLNTCWRRFVVCKELAHLLIDTDAEHFAQDPVSLVQELINDVPVMRPDHDVNSERCAMVAAIEMLLPWCLRGRLAGNPTLFSKRSDSWSSWMGVSGTAVRNTPLGQSQITRFGLRSFDEIRRETSL